MTDGVEYVPLEDIDQGKRIHITLEERDAQLCRAIHRANPYLTRTGLIRFALEMAASLTMEEVNERLKRIEEALTNPN